MKVFIFLVFLCVGIAAGSESPIVEEVDESPIVEEGGESPVEPNEDHTIKQWYLDTEFGIAARSAWQAKTVSKPIVALIGTGCAKNKDLQGKVCKAHETCSGIVEGPAGAKLWDPRNDMIGHGTAMAGLVAAKHDNDFGIEGVCRRCRIMCSVCADKTDLQLSYAELMPNLLLVVNHILQHPGYVKVLYFGLSYYWSEGTKTEKEVFAKLSEADILVVARAGEQGCDLDGLTTKGCSFIDWETKKPEIRKDPHTPTKFHLPNMIVVAAGTKDFKKTASTNYGKTVVDLFAPGENITILCDGIHNKDCITKEDTGSSYAAGLVTGAAGEIFSVNPDLSAIQAKEIILSTVRHVPEFKKYSATGGMLNLAAAVKKAKKTVGDNAKQSEKNAQSE